MAEGRVCDLFLLVRGVLTTYNASSPFVSLDNWQGEPCSDCGRTVGEDDGRWCSACEREFCDDCATFCHICDDTICLECRDKCPVCGESICPSCMTTCPDCHATICKNCLAEQQCPCQEDKENEDDAQRQEQEPVAAAAPPPPPRPKAPRPHAAAGGQRAAGGGRGDPVLRFSPQAWGKLLYFRDRGPTEIGGFGITPADDLLYVQDFLTVKQAVTAASVSFDDAAVADFMECQVDAGLKPGQVLRVWCHTHPACHPSPAGRTRRRLPGSLASATTP